MATLPTSRQPASDPTSTLASQPGWPRRAVVWGLGTVLVFLNAFFGAYIFVVVQALLWTQTSLLRGPLVGLFFLAMANLLLIRIARRLAFSQAELLLLYTMLCVGTCAGGVGFVQMLISQITGPFYFATPSNSWQARLWPYIPLWMSPRQADVLKGFYQGNSSLYIGRNLSAWAVPVAAWTAFIFAIFWVFLCMVALLRRRWIEDERLTFPLAYLPLEMSAHASGHGEASPFWKNRLMWTGFLIAGVLESINYVSYIYPSVPSVPIKPIGHNELDLLLTSRPWNAAGMLRLAFYPFAIGIAYLLSLEVSFSCWFLYLCVKLANVACAAAGLSEGGGIGAANRAPYIREQSVGAFLGLALFSVWMARHSLAAAWKEIRWPTGADRSELMPYRLAMFGGGGGALFLIGFLTFAGLSLPLACVLVFVYLCFAITLARIVSEAGAGWAFSPNWSAAAFTMDTIGADHLSPANVTLLGGSLAWMSDMRDNPMPQQIQGAKLGQSGGAPLRSFLWPVVWASLFGILCAFWAHLHIYYIYGAATAKVRPWLAGMGLQQANATANLLATRTPRDTTGFVAAGFGMIAVIACSQLRLGCSWWPFHPLGYALATTNSMDYMWCPFLIAWLAKSVTVRYGGLRAYRTALPFFLGLMLGDYVVPTIWGMWGMVTGQQQYMAFPH